MITHKHSYCRNKQENICISMILRFWCRARARMLRVVARWVCLLTGFIPTRGARNIDDTRPKNGLEKRLLCFGSSGHCLARFFCSIFYYNLDGEDRTSDLSAPKTTALPTTPSVDVLDPLATGKRLANWPPRVNLTSYNLITMFLPSEQWDLRSSYI